MAFIELTIKEEREKAFWVNTNHIVWFNGTKTRDGAASAITFSSGETREFKENAEAICRMLDEVNETIG